MAEVKLTSKCLETHEFLLTWVSNYSRNRSYVLGCHIWNILWNHLALKKKTLSVWSRLFWMAVEEMLINSSAVNFGFWKQVKEDLVQGESSEKLTENHLALDPCSATEPVSLSVANILRLVNSKGASDVPKQAEPQLCKCSCNASQTTTHWQTALGRITEGITSSQLNCNGWPIYYYLTIHWDVENSQLPSLLKRFFLYYLSTSLLHLRMNATCIVQRRAFDPLKTRVRDDWKPLYQRWGLNLCSVPLSFARVISCNFLYSLSQFSKTVSNCAPWLNLLKVLFSLLS